MKVVNFMVNCDLPFVESVIVTVTVLLSPGDISGSERLDEMNSWNECSASNALSINSDTLTHIGLNSVRLLKSSGSKVTLDSPTKA